VLRHLPQLSDPRALVGVGSRDDAAVFQVSESLAIVATVDYITPVVDDPYAFGQVAAANALSDVFAMGAEALFALNIVNFPRDSLPLETLGEIVRGGVDKAAEANVAILGGHSVDDPEIKYGMTAIGVVHPDRIIRNVGGRPGDRLILTKPIGTGVITTAIKAGKATPDQVSAAVRSMSMLNYGAAQAMLRVGVHAATDVTGFGLLGHLGEMLTDGTVDAVVYLDRVPLLPGTRELAEAGAIPGGSRRNLESFDGKVAWSSAVAELDQLILSDAQTSGGMLLAVPEERAQKLTDELKNEGVLVADIIGELRAGAGVIQVQTSAG
jgi:selenide, water dikinase